MIVLEVVAPWFEMNGRSSDEYFTVFHSRIDRGFGGRRAPGFFARKGGQENRITPLDGLAFGFVLAGILFGSDRILGYCLLGIGMILGIIDLVNRSKSK
jgi:hypothetical protein